MLVNIGKLEGNYFLVVGEKEIEEGTLFGQNKKPRKYPFQEDFESSYFVD